MISRLLRLLLLTLALVTAQAAFAQDQTVTVNFDSNRAGVDIKVVAPSVTFIGGKVVNQSYIGAIGNQFASFACPTCNPCPSCGAISATFDVPVVAVKFKLVHNSPEVANDLTILDDKGHSVTYRLKNHEVLSTQWPYNDIKKLLITQTHISSWSFAIDDFSFVVPSQFGIVARLGDNPDDPNPPEPTLLGSTVSTAKIPLGRTFSLRLKVKRNGTWVDVPGSFALGAAVMQPPPGGESLFPVDSVFMYNDTSNQATRLFQSVRLGTTPLHIIPTDTNLRQLDLKIESATPASLGTGTNANTTWDSRFWTQASIRGIPPQYTKAIGYHESEHVYDRHSWRYEPDADRRYVAPLRADNDTPQSDYRLPSTFSDGNLAMGVWLCPSWINAGCVFPDMNDILAASALSFKRAGVVAPIPSNDVNQHITIREICDANPGQNWQALGACPPVAPPPAPVVYQTNRPRPSQPPDQWAQTATPHEAASYGIMQTTWYSAIDQGIFPGVAPPGVPVPHQNPSLLFDDEANLTRGTASMVVGPNELRWAFNRVNLSSDVINPDYDSPAQFADDMRSAVIAYNGTGQHAIDYADLNVLPLLPRFLAQATSGTTIMGQGCDSLALAGDVNSANIVPGGQTTLAVAVSGADRYQWYIGNIGDLSSPVPASNSNFITVSPAVTTTYWVRAANACESVTSQGTVNVGPECPTPQFISTTDDRTVVRGTLVPLASPAVNVTGFQWYQISQAGAWSLIINATAATVDVTPQTDTTYVAVARNSCGQVLSRFIRITVTPCDNAAVAVQPAGGTVHTGESFPLSLTPGGTGPFTVVWWTAAGTTVGSGASISVSPTATTSYYAIVSNGCGTVQSATVTVAVTGNPTCVAPAITTQPAGAAINSGEAAALSLASSGTSPLTVTWKTGSGATVGSGNSISVSPTATTSYYATVSNNCGTVTSGTVTVTVNCLPRITVQPASVSITSGSSTVLSVTAVGPGPITVNWYTAAGVLSATGASINVAPTTTMSGYAVVSNSCGSVQSNTITVTVNPTCVPPQITAQPAGSNVVSGASATLSLTASGDAPLAVVWRNAGGSQIGTGTSLSVSPTQTTSYYATVTNGCGSVQSNSITVTVCHPPAITTQPSSQTLTASGQQAALSVGATGDGLSYQWFARDPSGGGAFVTMAGATAASLQTLPMNPTADYYVRVNGSCGTVNSSIVTVTRPPDCVPATVGTQPQPVTINAGQTTTLSAAGAGSDPFTYQWMESTDGNHYSPSSWGSGATLYTTPPMTTYYYCNISNSCGLDVTHVTQVTVNGCIAPSVTTHPQSTSVQANHATTLTAFGYGGQANLQVWYTWYSSTDGVHFDEILWGNGTSLQVTPSTTSYYFCRIGNYCSTVDTSVATVTVTP